MDDSLFAAREDDGDAYKDLYKNGVLPLKIQIILSLGLGVSAFLTFCVLRPRWTGLYAARKKQKDEATTLPELPGSMFGWIWPLWRITDQQLLASAGLDAYVFLAFFKMAIKFLAVALFFSLAVIKPVHDAHQEISPDHRSDKNKTHHHNDSRPDGIHVQQATTLNYNLTNHIDFSNFETDYLWMYVVFAYLFSALALYLMLATTRRIIEVRQEYLGAQNSLTDRTIRLSGIPLDLRQEESVKEFVESLDVGKVESVMLCRDWNDLDVAMEGRMKVLRRLEEAYTTYLGRRRVERNLESLPVVQPTPPSPRGIEPYSDREVTEEGSTTPVIYEIREGPYARIRPKTTIRYGFLRFRSTKVDAIEYFEGQLRQADARIQELRKTDFTPTPLAFVTMDSVAACQTAIQAVLDPSPLQLIASQSPSPTDIIWANTYLSHRNRVFRSWCVTSVILLLTLVWASLFVGITGLLTLDSIGKVFPRFVEFLESKEHQTLKSLVVGPLPTLITSLLIVLVPYVYYWLSWYQGFISQRDVELSAISKNFFFTFFNFFVVFTVSGTGIRVFEIFQRIGEALTKDLASIMFLIAQSLQELSEFYVNFIIFQGVGLLPFRLLEMGSVSLYPVFRMGAKTPRDYAELVQPPAFIYGFYLPTTLLIFIICVVYSVLRESWRVHLAGLVYFALGHFVYKYQLLYAMDNTQHATGRAWVMICDRIFVGLVFFQVATIGQLALKQAFTRGALMVPLLVATLWMSSSFSRTYKPLMTFIALRSVKQGEQYVDEEGGGEEGGDEVDSESTTSAEFAPERRAWAESGELERQRQQEATAISHERSNGSGVQTPRYINPSLVAPLSSVWITDRGFRSEISADASNGDEPA